MFGPFVVIHFGSLRVVLSALCLCGVVLRLLCGLGGAPLIRGRGAVWTVLGGVGPTLRRLGRRLVVLR